MKDDFVRVRGPKPNDLHMIIDSWMKSYQRNDDTGFWKSIERSEYNAGQRSLIINALEKCSASILCTTEDEDHIIGYCVYDDDQMCPALHFIYIKQPFRRAGFATQLLESIPLDFKEHTQETKLTRFLSLNTKHNPFRLYGY